MRKPVTTGIQDRLPNPGEPGAFAAVRKHDIHTGVDIYCDEGAVVYAVEAGVVVAVERFTGEHAGSPWWNDTWAVLVAGESGVIVYGEISLWSPSIVPGADVWEGDILGRVVPVLKQDKGITPTSMLHFELLKPGTAATGWWYHGDPQPDYLLDPTTLLRDAYARY